MKKILFILLLFSSLGATAQVIDSKPGLDTATVDGVLNYIAIDTITEKTASSLDKVTIVRTPLGDSATAAQYLRDQPLEYINAAMDGLQKAFLLRIAINIFNQVNPYFQAITGTSILRNYGLTIGDSWVGDYSVILEDDPSFDAVIEYSNNFGNMRLRRISDDTNWTVIPLNRSGIRLQNFDHDKNGSGELWYLTSGPGQYSNIFFPVEFAMGKVNNFRIKKR